MTCGLITITANKDIVIEASSVTPTTPLLQLIDI